MGAKTPVTGGFECGRVPRRASTPRCPCTTWAASLGLVYVIGRLVYFIGYTRAANKRGIGFLISALPTMILMLGGLIGAAMAALR